MVGFPFHVPSRVVPFALLALAAGSLALFRATDLSVFAAVALHATWLGLLGLLVRWAVHPLPSIRHTFSSRSPRKTHRPVIGGS